ncbi:MAG: hypothetical protein E7240_04315 [Lachnospiraceae bacterium]|nr:hypothetical protein [Lachnospiraceae bacterium]
MTDLISRQAVKEWLTRWEGYIDTDIIARMQCRVVDIPSAQLLQLTCNPLATDCIDRQAAIDALDKHFEERLRLFDYDSYEQADDNTRRVCDGIADAIEVVDNLPSAQLDPDMIHLQKEQAYMQGYEDGQAALRADLWDRERERWEE